MNIIQKLISEITAPELLLFVSASILIVIIIIFYGSNKANSKMKQESRCYRESALSTEHGIYKITAKVSGRPAFDVSYNTEDDSTNISCACPEGDVESVFTKIPYYDMRPLIPYKNRLAERDKLTCKCESGISSDATDPRISYVGEPEIRKFMYNPERYRDFFDNIIYNNKV